jgi:hypothetical protein
MRVHLVAAALWALASCSQREETCELAAEQTAGSLARLGCYRDFEVLSSEKSDAVFSRTRSVNVIVDREDGDRIYFIDTDRWILHYEFASEHLDLPGKTPVGSLAEFNLLNYRRPNRRFLLGKTVHYVDQDLFTMELAAGDTADAALIIEGFTLVRAAHFAGDRLRYRPVSAGQEALLEELAAQIPVVRTDEVFTGQTYQALNPGVGYGTLRFRRLAELGSTPVLPTDFVVLDRVPNDISMVAGLITAEFQTPLAHVNVLAKTRGTPNMALRDAWTDEDLRAFEGTLVRIEVGLQDFTIAVASATEAQAYWDALRPGSLQVPVHDSTTTFMFNVSALGVADAVRIGNKAANLGELYRVRTSEGLPLLLPEAPLAIPFAHYASHLQASGVQADIDELLAKTAAGTLSPSEVEQRLFAIRWKIYRAPMDPGSLATVAGIAEARWGVDTKLRFRSSTNVEDLEDFTGAGLYTSAAARPSDGTAQLANAIKTVWASAWNHQAFVERDFYRVDHRQVRVAVLVHPGFAELANGVAITINEFSDVRPAFYINSQISDISVTNPAGHATPEQILYYTWYEEPEYEVISRSSLLGWMSNWPSTTAVLTDEELLALEKALRAIHARFAQLYPGPSSAVDVEWKLDAQRQIVIKQARPFRSRQITP